MMSSVLATLLLLLVPSDASAPRKAYSACLVKYVQSSAEKKMPVDQFDSTLGTACSSEEQAFRKSVVSSDVARGISRKTSEQGVADEVADYVADAKERYRSYASAPQ
jgi:hypothetical protein